MLDLAYSRTHNSVDLGPDDPKTFTFFDDGGGRMERFWDAQPEGLVFWLAVLALWLAVAVYVIGKVRPKAVQNEPTASQWLTKYQELHGKGVLSDEEFRTIKSTLSKQLQDELNTNGDKGSNE
jgi:hypothetical protein